MIEFCNCICAATNAVVTFQNKLHVYDCYLAIRKYTDEPALHVKETNFPTALWCFHMRKDEALNRVYQNIMDDLPPQKTAGVKLRDWLQCNWARGRMWYSHDVLPGSLLFMFIINIFLFTNWLRLSNFKVLTRCANSNRMKIVYEKCLFDHYTYH